MCPVSCRSDHGNISLALLRGLKPDCALYNNSSSLTVIWNTWKLPTHDAPAGHGRRCVMELVSPIKSNEYLSLEKINDIYCLKIGLTQEQNLGKTVPHMPNSPLMAYPPVRTYDLSIVHVLCHSQVCPGLIQ